MSKINPNLSREEKIALLQKIAAGEATAEDFQEKEMVYWVGDDDDDEYPTGLYVNGKLSTNPVDLEEYHRAFRACEVEVNISDSPFGEPFENPFAKPVAETNDPE